MREERNSSSRFALTSIHGKRYLRERWCYGSKARKFLRESGRGSPNVPMVQSTQSRKRDDFAPRVAGLLYRTTVRGVLLESEV